MQIMLKNIAMALVESTFNVSVPNINNWDSYENDLMREKMDVIQKISELKHVNYIEMLDEFLPGWKPFSQQNHINHNALIPKESKSPSTKKKIRRKRKPKKQVSTVVTTQSKNSTEHVKQLESEQILDTVTPETKEDSKTEDSKTENSKTKVKKPKTIVKKRRKPKNKK